MRKIIFTDEECTWLKPLLEERIECFNNEEFNIPQKYLNWTTSALLKLTASTEVFLSDWEQTMCSSCTREEVDNLYRSIELPDAFSLLDSTSAYLAELHDIDIAENIITKLYRRKYKSRRSYERVSYSEYLSRLKKLKQSDLIYLSGNTSPYKIGFVYQNKEVCVFELRHKIELHSLSFYSINMSPDIYGKTYFQSVTTRQQALERLTVYTENEYVEGQLRFLKELLN